MLNVERLHFNTSPMFEPGPCSKGLLRLTHLIWIFLRFIRIYYINILPVGLLVDYKRHECKHINVRPVIWCWPDIWKFSVYPAKLLIIATEKKITKFSITIWGSVGMSVQTSICMAACSSVNLLNELIVINLLLRSYALVLLYWHTALQYKFV